MPVSETQVKAVEIRNVSKSYGSIPAVIDVSLDIERREFISLLGPSGCGKSTFLRMIAGFERPTTGSIHLMGEPIDGVPPHRRATNLIFQHLALFPHLNVFENVAFGLRMKRVDRSSIKQRVERILDLVQLSGFAARSVLELSGGQRQRVAIARALINEPAVLLLDEPLAALDVHLKAQMQVELKEIQRRVGTTFIYVTHDQAEALAMSDRIAVMRAGILEQIGAARSVYEEPRTRFVASFLGDSNILTGEVVAAESHRTMLRVADKVFSARLQPTLRVGDKAYLSIRPERVRTSMPAAPVGMGNPENVCEGVVHRVTFKGAMVECKVRAGFGEIVATAPSTGFATLNEGQTVLCSWDAEAGILLRD